MTAVIVKNDSSGQMRLCQVPNDYSLHAGDMVLFTSIRSKNNQTGMCLCDSFVMPENKEIEQKIFSIFKISDAPDSEILGVYNLNKFDKDNI